eukprot:COSAG02_NODE_1179_length_14040_cov_8.036439_1_plen_1312_part_00
MGGMDEMGIFYDHCLETLYPPGMCGMLCNQHTYECRLAEVNEACCTERGNCNGDGIPTNDCPVGCALVFPIFVLECRDHAESQGIAVGPLDTMSTTCESLDAGALVEYAQDLMNQGCSLDFSGQHRRMEKDDEHRQLQIASQWLDSRDPQCTWDDLNDRANEVDDICCTNGMCVSGIPDQCNAMCAIIFHQFTTDCGLVITSILGQDGRVDQLLGFDRTCTDSLDTDALMRAIAGANCNDDVIGRGEICDGAADLNLSFLGTEADSSGNHRGIIKHGDTVLMPTGVHFDGDGDYFTVPTWDYALDATFSISVWMVKEECTAGLYEYLYSHQTDDTVGTDQIAEGGVRNAFVMFYIGCEGQGAVTSTLQGAVMRYWISDDAGTAGVFDYPLHDAGDFDSITDVWTAITYVQTPTGVTAYNDGTPIPTGQLGFPATQPNQANPDPLHFSAPLSALHLSSDLYVGGRADRAGDRHFRGTMAMLMVSNIALTDSQVSCYFHANEDTLAALPPVTPPPSSGEMSCHLAVAAMMGPGQLDVCLPTGGSPVCTGRCGTLFEQIASSCANEPPATVDCGTASCDQRQAASYNANALKSMCAALPPGCEPDNMMPIIESCNLPGGSVPRGWKPECPCDAATLMPLVGCASSFGATVGMTPQYIADIQAAAQTGCIGGAPTLQTVPTDGTSVEGLVRDADGILFQFQAEAGQTYLLDTEVGTLDDTVMELIDMDQQATIAENDDDERATGQLDSYIEWTCPTTGTYFINVYGYAGATGTISLTVTQAEDADDPCSGQAELSESNAVISFTPRGGTEDNQHCLWRIDCRRGVATLSFQRFSTESGYDYVNIYDGRDTQAEQVLHASGPMTDLDRLSYTSSSPMMVIEFQSDESIGAEGFEASYECGTAPPPPATGPTFTPLTIGAPMASGEVVDRGGVWYQFQATQGNTYQIETDAQGLSDTMLELVDSDQRTTLAENDDDSRNGGRLDSYIEWTCPETATYYINVKGYGGSVGTFTVGVTANEGGDPCSGGVTFVANSAVVRYTPEGGTLDSTTCRWTIQCPADNTVDMSFTRFSTESYFDTVTLYDGGQGGESLGSLSGELSNLPQTEYYTTQNQVLVEFTTDASVGANGFEMNYACAGSGSGGLGAAFVTLSTEQYSAGPGISGYQTWRVIATPSGSAANVYTVYGQAGAPMQLPSAYQVAAPFGADTGGTNPAFWAVSSEAQYDSWITVGLTNGDSSSSLASIGLDFNSWADSDYAYTCDDCAVFWMAPDSAPSGDTTLAQFTVRSGSTSQATFGLQGRSRGGAHDWQAHGMQVTIGR